MIVINFNPWWQFVCNSCGATCQADVEDVTSRPSVSDIGKLCWVPIVNCGKCHARNDVPSLLIDEKIMEIVSRSHI